MFKKTSKPKNKAKQEISFFEGFYKFNKYITKIKKIKYGEKNGRKSKFYCKR